MDHEIEAAIADFQRYLHTGMPGKAVAWNSTNQTVTVRPMVVFVDVDDTIVTIPDIPDVLVQYPGGGGVYLTFPINPGDECFIHFSERCIDSWWDTGNLGEVLSMRLHDLSDGFAAFGYSSKPNVVPNPDKDAIAIRTKSGNAYVKVKAGGEVIIDGTKLTVLCPVEMKQTQKVTGAVTMESTQTVAGLLSGNGGMTIKGGSGSTFTGNVNHSGGTMISNGIPADTHKHTEHDGFNTGGPKA